MTAETRPQRGTRLPNRRQLILDAASQLFADRGYEHVSVSDIAAEVEVGPSALYRHFASKEQILLEAIGAILDTFTATLEEGIEQGDVLVAAAAFGLDHRAIAMLWEREARHLPAPAYAVALERLRVSRTTFVEAVAPGVGADITRQLGALAVILSPSFHHVDLPRPTYERLLAELASRVLATNLPTTGKRSARVDGLHRSSKREELVCAAVELFAQRTYASVSMEDIAASVGLAASSLYNHLPSKSDLLLRALTRCEGFLQVTLDGILAASANATDALQSLVEIYSRFAMQNPAFVDVMMTEVRNLPDDANKLMLGHQREYVGEWAHLLREIHPGLDEATSKVTVQAAMMLVNDLARFPGTRSRADAEQAIAQLARSVLGI